MILPWSPIVCLEIIGSTVTLWLAFFCAYLSWSWFKNQNEDLFRDYILLFTTTLIFFACSRSIGHLLKQLLFLFQMHTTWYSIAPYSGALNSSIFIIIFTFCLYYNRINRILNRLVRYKDDLKITVSLRTKELEQTNSSLTKEITDRKQVEEDLRQSKATLENILNSAPPLSITDLDFNVIKINDSYRKVWPLPENPSESIKCYQSRPGELCHTEKCPLILIARGENTEVTSEVEKTLNNGNNLIFIQTTRPFYNADQEMIGIVTSFQEISEQKKAERALAAERENLAVTLRSIGDGVITTDTHGRVMMLNKIAENLCGWQQNNALGRPFPEIFHLIEDTTGMLCSNPVKKILASGDIVTGGENTILVSRNGTRRAIADSGAPIRNPESKIIGVVLVIRDITERKRMEQDILKVKKLESVGILAGGIAHDFNNILTSILGNINLARQLPKESEEISSLLHEAEKASLRAKDLTQQLLTFSKGGAPIRKTASIAGVIRDSASFILRGSNLTCNFHIPDDLWLVDIDQGQISQVIQNIILNARQAMPGGGTITINCENISQPITKQKFINIIITDYGHGISAALLDKIFDPYFTTSKDGSGLGLAICHSIITKHEGTLEAKSRLGAGTTFTITLPASTSSISLDKPIEEKYLIEKHGKILIMDDEKSVLNIAEQILTHLGHTISCVDEGEKAIEIYRQAFETGDPFDLTIMDLTIPNGMGGKKAVKNILEINPEARVIVASGYCNDPVMANYKKYGFSGCLNKPFQLKEMNKLIQQTLH
ncbi:MAG: PAS domain S-box protein [Desulfobulbaceae bacterium]|nr:PAS domain S-box protein [Desulfobulbaceae bacterium]